MRGSGGGEGKGEDENEGKEEGEGDREWNVPVAMMDSSNSPGVVKQTGRRRRRKLTKRNNDFPRLWFFRAFSTSSPSTYLQLTFFQSISFDSTRLLPRLPASQLSPGGPWFFGLHFWPCWEFRSLISVSSFPCVFLYPAFSTISLPIMSARPSSAVAGPDAWEDDWESQADVCSPAPISTVNGP